MQKTREEMPFMVPEGFFADMQATVFSRLATDFGQADKGIRRTLITKLMYAAACAHATQQRGKQAAQQGVLKEGGFEWEHRREGWGMSL